MNNKKTDSMKRYIKILLILLLPMYGYAQSELPSDSLKPTSKAYKLYGDFILDMSLFSILPPTLPKISLELPNPSLNYNQLLQLEKMPLYNSFHTPNFSPFSYGGFLDWGNSSVLLQSQSFQLNDNLILNTFGQYDEQGRKIPTPGLMPWQKDHFIGGFELKSKDNRFGIRVEVRQGGRNPYAPY